MIDLNALALPDLFRALHAPEYLPRLLEIARDEDLGPGGVPGDVTSNCSITQTQRGDGVIVARQAGVLSGGETLPHVARVFAPGCRLDVRGRDGQMLTKGETIAVLSGPMRQVLAAERTMLNLLGRMCGIATRTAEFVRAVEGTRAKLLDTRKTTPGWRALEKYAVRCGGGHCHRIGLYDAVLLKDNHLAGVSVGELAGWVRDAAKRAREAARAGGSELRFVEAEVDSLEQFEALLRGGACEPGVGVDIVLLDNMTTEQLRRAVGMRSGLGSRVLLEASGGVTLGTIRGIAQTGVDRISVGGLTHQAVGLDVAMDVG